MQNNLCKISVTIPDSYEETVSIFFTELGAGGLEIQDSGTPGSSVAKNFVSLITYLENDKCNTFYENLSEFLEKLIPAGSGRTYVLTSEKVENKNWEEVWKETYDIQHISNLVIVPGWKTYEPVENELVFKIDPGMAFGTGLHETTRLCIIELFDLSNKNNNFSSILDLGTGTGILAMTAEKLFSPQIIDAVDNDPLATNTAKQVIKENIPDSIIKVSENLRDFKYDLIIANINADALIGLSSQLSACLNSNGILILSGITTDRETDILKAYDPFEITNKNGKNEWIMLEMKKKV